MSFRPCAVIPVYNHHAGLARITNALLGQGLRVILVDDGSDAATKQVLQELAAGEGRIECLTLAKNGGKGGAVLAGMERARERGFSHALQIDADGQHETADVPAMLALAAQHPYRLISGVPQY
ncbi:MAG TPA: glycosyltransferase family 2 protein, partial [Gammaproteobacteria bacterium]|nr:glycosyltransferase family 2 protein [Gammaproteobacteria bacterium]